MQITLDIPEGFTSCQTIQMSSDETNTSSQFNNKLMCCVFTQVTPFEYHTEGNYLPRIESYMIIDPKYQSKVNEGVIKGKIAVINLSEICNMENPLHRDHPSRGTLQTGSLEGEMTSGNIKNIPYRFRKGKLLGSFPSFDLRVHPDVVYEKLSTLS